MLSDMKERLTSWYLKFSRRISYKLMLTMIIPNIIFFFMMNQLMNQQLKQKTQEMDNMLYVLNHAVSREMSGLFSNISSLTNEIMVNPSVQQILTGEYPTLMRGYQHNTLFSEDIYSDKYVNRRTMKEILDHYRILWDVFSIAVISKENDIYLSSTSAVYNYEITALDLENSIVMKEIRERQGPGFAWSVNDALTKNRDTITLVRKIYGINQPQEVIGYMVVNLSLEAVRDSFKTYNYYESMVFGLINESGDRWMVYDGKEILGGNGSLLKDVQVGFSSINWKGHPWYVSLSITEEGNYVISGLDKGFMEQQLLKFKEKLYLGYIFFLCIAFFISIRGTKSVTDRLNMLEKAIRNFGLKKWKTRIELKGNDEIQTIGNTFNDMASQIEALIENVKKEQRLKRIFELRVLEYQMNPHFLYNTLDSINWLALENNQREISQMVNGLAKLFRIILSKGKEVITLREEFEMIGIYLDIQKIRFEERFEYGIALEPEIADYPIEKLLLQPLVENTIVHGMRGLRTKGNISIRGIYEGEYVVLEVTDNGLGMSDEDVENQLKLLDKDIWQDESISAKGYGMKNVDSRLKLMFGKSYYMTIASNKDMPSGTTVRIHIHKKAMEKRLQTAHRE